MQYHHSLHTSAIVTRPRAIVTTLCDDSSSMLFPCCACGVDKSEAPAHQDVSTSSFRRCSTDGWRPTSEFTGASTLCDARAKQKKQREAREKRERENEANRTRARGACRVKEVKQRYGHVCEIPLQAYMEAEVAYSKNDFVTDQDVKAASDAWDARSIAHDIDTQWGAMPWGGAYKDSNEYWGPSEYDFF